MATTMDGLRERWERMNPREQRLAIAFSLTVVIAIVVAMVAKIQSGMAEIEAKNAESRKALVALALYRNAKAGSADNSVEIEIPERDKAVALDIYLEGIISELDLTLPTVPALKEDIKGDYVEQSFEITLKGLDLTQTTLLLEKIETGNKLVVVKEINIDRNFKDKKKLNLVVRVATYRMADEKDGKGKKKKKKKNSGGK